MSYRFCALLKSVFWVMLLAGCKQKQQPPRIDKEQQLYAHYRHIFDNYKVVPLDSTVLQMDSFLTAFPQDARGWAFYGRLMYDLDSLERSIAAYKKAILYNPRFSEGYAGVGSVYHVLNEADSAEHYLMKAVEHSDSSAYTFLNLSMLYLQKRNFERSTLFADSALARYDSSAAVCCGLSYIYKEQKQQQKSLDMYLLAIQLGLQDSVAFKEVLKGKVPIQSFFKNNRY